MCKNTHTNIENWDRIHELAGQSKQKSYQPIDGDERRSERGLFSVERVYHFPTAS